MAARKTCKLIKAYAWSVHPQIIQSKLLGKNIQNPALGFLSDRDAKYHDASTITIMAGHWRKLYKTGKSIVISFLLSQLYWNCAMRSAEIRTTNPASGPTHRQLMLPRYCIDRTLSFKITQNHQDLSAMLCTLSHKINVQFLIKSNPY